ncbi:MAG: hypothetical protein GC164_12665 [Phycisphaera sp.]|nr:hypothetical protein [Phycisphaera sp.]
MKTSEPQAVSLTSAQEPRGDATGLSTALAAGGLLVLIGIWVASQEGVAPVEPAAFVRVLAMTLTQGAWVALIWLSALGFGLIVKRVLLPNNDNVDALIPLGLGMGAWMLFSQCLGVAGLVGRGWAWSFVGLGVLIVPVYAARTGAWKIKTRHALTWKPTLSALLACPAVGVLLTACACPPGTLWSVEAFAYDVKTYHLQLPREWLASGSIHGLYHNVYSYLPNLVESTYTLLGSMTGSVVDHVYAMSLFHASLGVYAACVVASLASKFGSKAGGAVGAAALLALPWVLITGSLAYDEMAVLAFGAAALWLMFSDVGKTWRGCCAVGFMVGCATLCKLTAGPMVALPVVLVYATRLNQANQKSAWNSVTRSTWVVVVATFATLSPWLVRNTAWSGNPVFPFATQTLGLGHWSSEQSEKWQQVHTPERKPPDALATLSRQWLFNTGFGSVGGVARQGDSRYDVARFDRTGGLPVFWLAALVSMGLSLSSPGARRTVAAMLLILLVQVVFWMNSTHMQSRFLITTLLPGAVIVGVGFGRIDEMTREKWRWVLPVTAIGLLALLTVSGLVTLWSQGPTVYDPRQRTPVHFGTWQLIGALDAVRDHPVNQLPIDSKTLLVADVSSLLYLDRPVVYHSAFDRDVLGDILRDTHNDPSRATQQLVSTGITHVWVGWSELSRLHETYGYDKAVTTASLVQLAREARWQVVSESPSGTLFKLAGER